ncbi:Clr5 domain-containing protein [Xylaria bambusicola]|uniref:Clr5 domain-containing protein n=1 Tax=Xylaria bambusicola TaxID=326684 RepID=UPI002007EEF8|nr:Clr5 domain-containing protein [Xylaria bambusicola]KAI0508917.1 Clr5 domain-containing protein [Xylaria bambusicola]
MSESYPSPVSDKVVASSTAPALAEPSPDADRHVKTRGPIPIDAQQPSNRRRRTHSPEAWESVKADIARLYLEENRRLKVRNLLSSIQDAEWPSYALPKMYKTKLTQWKFFKNNRQADVANMLYLQQHRLAMGKESTFRRNGRAIDVAAYMRRKGLRSADLLEMVQPGDLPPTLRCRTPPPLPPLPKKINAPDEFVLQEAYLHWTVEHPLMPPQMDANYFKGIDNYQASEAMRSVLLLTHGCWLLSIGKMNDGGAFCRRSFSTIDNILDQSAHFALYELLSSMSRYPDLGIQRLLWSYLGKYAAKIGGVNERLRRVLGAFANLARDFSLEHNVAMMQWGRRFSSNQSNGTFDGKPFDYTLIEPWDILSMNSSYYHRYYLNQGTWEADKIPTATIYSPDGAGDSWSLRADLLLMLGNQTAWRDERISAIAEQMLSEIPSDDPPQYLQFVCLYALAQTYHARCWDKKARHSPDHERARECLQKAVEGTFILK